MAGLTKIERELKPWTVVISGNTWQGNVSKTFHVTRSDLRPKAEFFKALILVKTLYDRELMDYEHVDSNITHIVRYFTDTFNVEPALKDDIMMEVHLRNFISEIIPYYTVAHIMGGCNKEYPTYTITIDIKDGKGASYELNYDDNDVIDALKTFELAK